MPTYHVTKSGGGYRVTDDPVEAAAVGAAGAAGSIVGALISGLVSVASERSKAARARVAESDAERIHSAAIAGEWTDVQRYALGFVYRYPTDPFGYEMLVAAESQWGWFDQILHIARIMEWRGMGAESVSKVRQLAAIGKQDVALLLELGQSMLDEPRRDVRARGYVARAQALLWLGDLNQALADADAALRESPSALAYEMRADIRWARGELADAANDYSRAVQVGPASAISERKLASVRAALDGGPDAKSAMANDPDAGQRSFPSQPPLVDPLKCTECEKQLSPDWPDRCEHCKAPYHYAVIHSRILAGYRAPMG